MYTFWAIVACIATLMAKGNREWSGSGHAVSAVREIELRSCITYLQKATFTSVPKREDIPFQVLRRGLERGSIGTTELR